MKKSRAKNRVSDFLAYQTSAGIPSKNTIKNIPFLLIAFLIFLTSSITGCKSGSSVVPGSGEEQKTVLTHKIRVTPKDFLFGLNENHPIVQAEGCATNL